MVAVFEVKESLHNVVKPSILMKKQAFMRDTLDMGALDCHSFLAGVNIGRYLSHVSPASILKALQDGAGDVDGVVKMYRIKFWRSFIDVLESLADWLTLKDLSQLDMACADKLGRPIFLGWLASKQKVFGSTYDFQYHSKKQSVFLEWILGRGVLVNRLKFKPSLVETFPTIIEVRMPSTSTRSIYTLTSDPYLPRFWTYSGPP